MSVEIQISSVFARYTNNQTVIQVKGNTVGECINDLVRQYPDLKRIILDKNGNLFHHYNIYINGENAYPREMTRPVKDGDKINITFLIQGG